MFGTHHIVKLVASFAVALAIAVVGARSAHAQSQAYNQGAYVYGGASRVVGRAIQSTGRQSVRFVTAARKLKAARLQAFPLITDTLGGDGQSQLPAHGGGRSTAQ